MGGAHTRHATGHPAASTTTARSTRPGTHRGWLLIITAALALLLAALPVSPASAAPVATTTALDWAVGSRLRLVAHVSRPDEVAPTGTVVFSENGVELGRAPLIASGTSSEGTLTIDWASGAHHYAAAYLGDASSAPSSATNDPTFTVVDPNATVTGSIGVGSHSLAVGPESDYVTAAWGLKYDPIVGRFDSRSTASMFVNLPLAGDVAGSGPVTLAVRPRWSGLVGSVDPTATVDLTATVPTLQIDRITVGGVTWAGGSDCEVRLDPLTLTGTQGPAGLAVTATTPAPAALAPTACNGRASLVNALIDGPVTFDLLLAGSFPPPPVDVPTTTTVTLAPVAPTIGERVTATATVVAAGGLGVTGFVEFRDNGKVIFSTLMTGGQATTTFFANEPGPHTITATYLGLTTPTATLRLPSAGSAQFTVTDPPAGRPTSGKITISNQSPVPFGPLSRLSGAAFDPATGAIGPGTFWLHPGQFFAKIGVAIEINYRLTQLAPITGQVAPDGTVTFTQASFRLDGRDYRFGSWRPLDCPFDPVTMTLTGRADATGLHLTGHATIPASTGYCAGYQSYVNPVFTQGADFVFDVAGDFRRTDATPIQVVSWYPTVDQHNQTYLSAAVTPTDGTTAAGTITFRDGTTVLGTAPLDPTGHAHLPVTLDQAGPRTITADYTGDHHPGWGATTIDVTPAPVGYALDGHITLGAATLPIGAGSQLLLATPPTAGDAAGAVAAGLTHQTASLWFMPTTITTDLPGYGPVTAEVRLNQYQNLSPATIDPGGTIDDLNGMFVLHIRKLTTTTGTTTPLGCVNLVLIAFDGRLTSTDVDLTTANAGTGRIPWGTCTGPAQALADQLTATPTATLHATL